MDGWAVSGWDVGKRQGRPNRVYSILSTVFNWSRVWIGGVRGYMDGGKYRRGGAMTAKETTPRSDGHTDLPGETRLSPLFAHTGLSCASGSSPRSTD